jgi:hypothetical protein
VRLISRGTTISLKGMGWAADNYSKKEWIMELFFAILIISACLLDQYIAYRNYMRQKKDWPMITLIIILSIIAIPIITLCILFYKRHECQGERPHEYTPYELLREVNLVTNHRGSEVQIGRVYHYTRTCKNCQHMTTKQVNT